VISIPLGFFGGIGGASKHGILIKGSNYLEALNKVTTIVFDKTGTLTKGVFKVTKLNPVGISDEALLEMAAYAEAHSNHPIAKSIVTAYEQKIELGYISEYEEIAGMGISIQYNGANILAGNEKLMTSYGVTVTATDAHGTVVHIAKEAVYQGYITISDEIKDDSHQAIIDLRSIGIKNIVMLTGDRKKSADEVADQLGITQVYSELLPQDKVRVLEELLEQHKDGTTVFVGDGINDAPVLARADVGVAMGGVGSDAAIEAADVVLMTDEISKLVDGLKIAKRTRQIVWQNIIFAMGVKALVLILGAGGLATMWEAVFADVGGAIIAILNATRIIKNPLGTK
jgi:Cd2+/Zn2+-exporting ATPase